jgi:hypothetical protein
MTDLDQLLGEALERRASVAGPGVTPAAVHLAVRRHRLRTAKVSAGFAITCAAVTGAIVLTAAGNGGSHPAGVSPAGPTTPAAGQDGTVVAELPWAGTTTLTLRRGATEAPDGVAFCIAGSCFSMGTPTSRGIILEVTGGGTIAGLAPHGTRRVLLVIGAQTPVSIPVSTTDDSTLPGVLYGVSSISAVAPGAGAFTLTYRLTAYDVDGRQLASRLVVGSADVALAHAPVGRLAALPSYTQNAALSHVAWTDSSGWACAGERSGSGATASFGADVCVPPHDVAHVALVNDDSSNQYVVLRVPTSVTDAELRGQSGRVVRATITDTGHGRLAAFDLSVGVPSANSTITCRDAAGAVVLATPMNSLSWPAGTVGADP